MTLRKYNKAGNAAKKRAVPARNNIMGMPTYCQINVTIGSAISGKMSFGMRRMETMPSKTISIATTTNVYGRLSASLTIHNALSPCVIVATMLL